MLEHERISYDPCGCHRDVTGLTTLYCLDHDPERLPGQRRPAEDREDPQDQPEPEQLELLHGTATPVYRPEEGTE